jgi:hypothetical protein
MVRVVAISSGVYRTLIIPDIDRTALVRGAIDIGNIFARGLFGERGACLDRSV